MHYYRLHFIWLIIVSFVGTAYAQNASTNDWQPNTRILGPAAMRHDPLAKDAASTLEQDVKKFYQALHDKQWHETYELRAKAFREDSSENDYLREAIRDEKIWGLVNYEVLSVRLQNSGPTNGLDMAILIHSHPTGFERKGWSFLFAPATRQG